MQKTNLKRLFSKASQSRCQYKVAAMGIDDKNRVIGFTMNKPRFKRLGGSLHAEMLLMARYGKNIKTIYICRTNNFGETLPIDPCPTCKAKADELGIKIVTIKHQTIC